MPQHTFMILSIHLNPNDPLQYGISMSSFMIVSICMNNLPNSHEPEPLQYPMGFISQILI